MTAIGKIMVQKGDEFLGDDELVLKAEQGDTDAIGILVNRYSAELYPYLVKMTGNVQTAEDVFQDTFARILSKKGKYHGQGNFRAFLFTIARNLVYDMLRKKRVRREVSLDAATEEDQQTLDLSVDEITPVDVLTKEELQESVEEAIEQLPPKLKEALVLKRFAGYSYQDIAEMVGCSTSAVKMRVSRALNQLAKLMTEFQNERSH